MPVDKSPRHRFDWYDQSSWPYPAHVGDRLLVRCDGGSNLSRLEEFPPRLEIDEPGGTYVLTDDDAPHNWVYVWIPASDRPR